MCTVYTSVRSGRLARCIESGCFGIGMEDTLAKLGPPAVPRKHVLTQNSGFCGCSSVAGVFDAGGAGRKVIAG